MASTWLKPGQNYTFSTKFGFTGSAAGPKPALNQPEDFDDNEYGNGTYVENLQGRALAKEKGYAQGGSVKAPMRGKTRNDDSTEEAANGAGFPVVTESMTEAASAPPAQGHKRGGRIKLAMGGNPRRSRGDDDWTDNLSRVRPATGDTDNSMERKPPDNARSRDVDTGSLYQHRDHYDEHLPADRNMRSGGPVKKAAGGEMPGPAPAQGAMSRATISMPVGDAAKAVKGTFQAGRAMGAKQALSRAVRPVHPQVGPPGATTALGAAPPPPVARSGIPTMAKGGHWIAGATQNKGALHRQLGVPAGDKIPAAKIEKAAHSDNPTLRRRAVLAETLKGFNKG